MVDEVEPILPSTTATGVTADDSMTQTQKPDSAFDQTAPIPEAQSDLPDPSPPKRPKTEEVVQVKKSSKSKPSKSVRNGLSDIPPRSSSPGLGMAGHKGKGKDSKTKKRSAEIPEFDYSTAPNLLDNPRSGIKDQGKKKKKEKKQPKGMTESVVSRPEGGADIRFLWG